MLPDVRRLATSVVASGTSGITFSAIVAARTAGASTYAVGADAANGTGRLASAEHLPTSVHGAASHDGIHRLTTAVGPTLSSNLLRVPWYRLPRGSAHW